MDKKEALNNIFNKVLELNLKGHNLLFEMDYRNVNVFDRGKFQDTGIGKVIRGDKLPFPLLANVILILLISIIFYPPFYSLNRSNTSA